MNTAIETKVSATSSHSLLMLLSNVFRSLLFLVTHHLRNFAAFFQTVFLSYSKNYNFDNSLIQAILCRHNFRRSIFRHPL